MSYWIQLIEVKSPDYNHQRALEELGLQEYLHQRLWRLSDEELRAHMGWPVYDRVEKPSSAHTWNSTINLVCGK